TDSATVEPVSLVAWRGDSPPRTHAHHAVRRTPRPIKVAAKAAPAIPIPIPSPQANQQTTGNAIASEPPRGSEAPRASDAARAGATDPPSASEVPQTRTTQEQVAAASAEAERMS